MASEMSKYMIVSPSLASVVFWDVFDGDVLAELFPQAGVWVPLLCGNNRHKLVIEFLSFWVL